MFVTININLQQQKRSIEQLGELVTLNDSLKQKEQEFKKSCKEELSKLDAEIENLQETILLTGESEDKEKYDKINEQYDATKSKMQNLRLKIAKKNREISTLKRKLDEIPSRNELTQYQKRFIELYNQSRC